MKTRLIICIAIFWVIYVNADGAGVRSMTSDSGSEQIALSGSIVWSGEAEDATLSGNMEIGTGCNNASGDFVKTQNESGNSILFEAIQIPEEKSYTLIIEYFQAAESRLEILVNGVSLGEIVFPAAQWCYQGVAAHFEMELSLLAGENSIELRVIEGITGPFVDRLQILDSSFNHVPKSYFISSSEGNDDNDGRSRSTAFQSLAKISSVNLGPADSILFKAGDVFTGQLVVNGSGKKDSMIVIDSYGEGEKPVLDGANAEGGAHLATILIQNNDHIEIRDLEITNERIVPRAGVSDALSYGIYVNNDGREIMEQFVFKHLVIKDIFAISIDGVEFNKIHVAGIRLRSESNEIAGQEKHIRDVLVDSCYFERSTRYGIFSTHGSGAEGVGNDSLNRNMNYVFSNNHFYHMGGSCITPGRTYNCLLENNIFENPGSGSDPRMANRGSGAWFWKCMNVLAQYNKIYHVRGYGDSYSMHVDFGNENVFFQYNYSEDSEGGFAEILGDNLNSVYRFNVSVNEGFRDNKGNSLWVSDFAGTNNRIRSTDSYIYNNTIYVDQNITPDISIVGHDTYIYNNIFYAVGASSIGQEVTVDITDGSTFDMSNNLFFGNVKSTFTSYDTHPVYGDPGFSDPGSSNIDGYIIGESSPARISGKAFPEPAFPGAGKGIFKDISMYPEYDLYGNPVKISSNAPSIGAFNGNVVSNSNPLTEAGNLHALTLFPNPVKEQLYIKYNSAAEYEAEYTITDLTGKICQSSTAKLIPGENAIELLIDPALRNGIYVFNITGNGKIESQVFVLNR